MMSVEIRINGSLIGHVYIHNEGPVDPIGDINGESSLYAVEYYEVGIGVVKKGQVTHRRADGAAVLVAKVFKWLTKKMR